MTGTESALGTIEARLALTELQAAVRKSRKRIRGLRMITPIPQANVLGCR